MRSIYKTLYVVLNLHQHALEWSWWVFKPTFSVICKILIHLFTRTEITVGFCKQIQPVMLLNLDSSSQGTLEGYNAIESKRR